MSTFSVPAPRRTASTVGVPRFDWRLSGALLVGAVAVVVGLLGIVGPGLGGDLHAAVRDPTFDAVESGALPLDAGVLSYLGVLGWWSAATAAVLGGWLLSGPGARAERRVLLSAGVLSAGLGLDDLYMGHDLVWPRLTGLSETPVMLGWVGAVVLWSWFNRRALGASRMLPVLWLAGVCFAVSLGVDHFMDTGSDRPFVFEDAAKFVGIGLWAAFHVAFVGDAVRERLRLR